MQFNQSFLNGLDNPIEGEFFFFNENKYTDYRKVKMPFRQKDKIG